MARIHEGVAYIPLSEWAKKNGIDLVYAKNWANRDLFKEDMRMLDERVERYYIREDAAVPKLKPQKGGRRKKVKTE